MLSVKMLKNELLVSCHLAGKIITTITFDDDINQRQRNLF
jgi:hypothetical protein